MVSYIDEEIRADTEAICQTVSKNDMLISKTLVFLYYAGFNFKLGGFPILSMLIYVNRILDEENFFEQSLRPLANYITQIERSHMESAEEFKETTPEELLELLQSFFKFCQKINFML